MHCASSVRRIYARAACLLCMYIPYYLQSGDFANGTTYGFTDGLYLADKTTKVCVWGGGGSD